MVTKGFLILTNSTITSAVFNNSGLILQTQGLHLEALQKFQATFALDPYNPVILSNLCVCYFSLDLFDLAIHSYKKAIILDPCYSEA